MQTETLNKIDFTRINNDINGNPRYVCHYLSIPVTEQEIDLDNEYGFRIEKHYRAALKKARKIGGKKFHNKQYGGGIVFQSYSLLELERQINELKNSN